MKINYRNLKILQLLDHNSRISTKEIAKEVKTSQQNVSYILSNFEKDKIIKEYSLLVDSSKFALSNFCVFLRVRKYSKTFLNEFTSELKKYKEITCIDFTFGEFDIFLRFTTPNASYFNKILRELLRSYSKDLSGYEILNQVVLYYYPSNFLSRVNFQDKIIVSGDRNYVSLDKTDLQIINQLNTNARRPYLEIAKNIKITPKTVITRIKNLERKNIIRGYSILLDHSKLSFNRYYLLLKFDYENESSDKKFITFTQQSQNIIELMRVFGKWDTLLVVVTKKPEEFREILYQIKEQFFETLEDYAFMESEEVRLWRYLPEL